MKKAGPKRRVGRRGLNGSNTGESMKVSVRVSDNTWSDIYYLRELYGITTSEVIRRAVSSYCNKVIMGRDDKEFE